MTERNEPVDRRHEEALSAALHEHARTVRPAGDGLVRIRSRVQRRRRRVHFLAPLASVAAAAAAVTAIVASGLLTSTPKRTTVADVSPSHVAVTTTTTRPAVAVKTLPPTTTPSASVAPASSTAPLVVTPTTVASTVPTTTSVVGTRGPTIDPPVWPFTTVADAASWQQTSSQKASEAWHLDARNVAERFVSTLMAGLGLPHFQPNGTPPVVGPDGTVTLDVTRVGPSGATVVLGTVKLARWGDGADSPWGVVSITSPTASKFPLTIKAPLPGAVVGAPLAVSLGMQGVEDDVYTSAWANGAASPAAQYHDPGVGSDKVETLRTGVPTSGTGFVAVLDGSTAIGPFGLSRLAVTPVRYGTSGGSTIVEAAKTYVGVVGKQLRVYDAQSNTLVRTIAAAQQTNAVASDGTWAYFIPVSSGTPCSTQVKRVRLDGTEGVEDVGSVASGAVSLVGVGGPAGAVQTWVQVPCGGQLSSATVHWRNTASGTAGSIPSPSDPPVAETLAVSPDGTQVSAFVRAGMGGNVETFKLGSGATLDQGGSVPSGCASDGSYECVGAAYAANGDLVVVRSDGSKLSVLQLHSGHTTPLFSVTASSQLAHVSVDSTGRQVLLSAVNRSWIWHGSGAATALPAGVSDASW